MDVADPNQVTREQLVAYATSLNFPPEESRPPEVLNSYQGQAPISAVIAERGARKLTYSDLRRHGRIVAKVWSSGPYVHGVVENDSYLWVEFGDDKQHYRILSIPASKNQPITVLTTARFDWHPPYSGHAMVLESDLPLKRGPGIATMIERPQAIEDCQRGKVGGPKYYACWIPNSKDGSAATITAASGASDGWVQVTGQGCVCNGTKCTKP